MHIAALPSCVSSLLRTLRHVQALYGYTERFFRYAKHYSAILSGFSAPPSSLELCWALFCSATIFLLCWARLSSVKHFSAMLSPFRLYQAFFSSILSSLSALLSIFLLCWTFFCPTKHFSSMLSVVFCSAKHLSPMLGPFLLCLALFFYAVQYTAQQKNTRQSRKTTQHRRKMLGRAEKCSA